jgi:hypothetical protein
VIEDMKRRSKREFTSAMNTATEELDAWYREEKAKLAEAGLTGAELRTAELKLTMELGKRYKQREGKAKRQTSAVKLMERDALAGVNPLESRRRR